VEYGTRASASHRAILGADSMKDGVVKNENSQEEQTPRILFYKHLCIVLPAGIFAGLSKMIRQKVFAGKILDKYL